MIRVRSPTTRSWSGPGSRRCSTPRTTSRWSARPPTAPRRCGSPRSAQPDVVLMDIRMPGLDGIEATRQIAAQPDLAAVHVVILTTFELDEYVFEGLRAGAAGFLVKDTDAAELIRAVRVVAGGRGAAVAHRDPAAHRRVRRPDPARRDRSRRGRADPAGARGGHAWSPAGCPTRRSPAALHEPVHGEDPRDPGHDQARRAGPRAARRVRLRGRPGPPRLVLERRRASASVEGRYDTGSSGTRCAPGPTRSARPFVVAPRLPLTGPASLPSEPVRVQRSAGLSGGNDLGGAVLLGTILSSE